MCRRWLGSARVEQAAGWQAWTNAYRGRCPVLRQAGKAQILAFEPEIRVEPGKTRDPRGETTMAQRSRKPSRQHKPAGADFWAARRLAAIGAIIGGILPLSRHGGGIPGRACARRRRRRARRAEGAAIPEIPRQERQARGARRKAAGGRDAGKPARRRHHADREILHPQQRADSRRDQESRRLEDHHRRRGQQQDRDHARRAEIEIQGGDAAHGAGMRRQRPRRVLAAGARQPVDQWRRRLRRMDRRAAGRRAEGRGPEADAPNTPRIMPPTCICRATPASRRSRAACASRRRWTPTP